jgi:hypothetical protein
LARCATNSTCVSTKVPAARSASGVRLAKHAKVAGGTGTVARNKKGPTTGSGTSMRATTSPGAANGASSRSP